MTTIAEMIYQIKGETCFVMKSDEQEEIEIIATLTEKHIKETLRSPGNIAIEGKLFLTPTAAVHGLRIEYIAKTAVMTPPQTIWEVYTYLDQMNPDEADIMWALSRQKELKINLVTLQEENLSVHTITARPPRNVRELIRKSITIANEHNGSIPPERLSFQAGLDYMAKDLEEFLSKLEKA